MTKPRRSGRSCPASAATSGLQIVWPTATTAACPNAAVAFRAEDHIADAEDKAWLADELDHAVTTVVRVDDHAVAVA